MRASGSWPVITLLIALVATTASAAGPASLSPLTCWKRAAGGLAEDPGTADELRRLTKFEAVRLLWSMAGDSAACANNRSNDAVMNAAYEYVRKLVISRHLYRD